MPCILYRYSNRKSKYKILSRARNVNVNTQKKKKISKCPDDLYFISYTVKYVQLKSSKFQLQFP